MDVHRRGGHPGEHQPAGVLDPRDVEAAYQLRAALMQTRARQIFPMTIALALLLAQAIVARAQEPPKITFEPLPDKPPTWLPGYRVRYPLRVVGDIAAQ